MQLELHILNNESKSNDSKKEVDEATWHMRHKMYESDMYEDDEDIITSPISHKLDRLIINDLQITSEFQIDKIIRLLNNAKPCFKR